MADSQGATGAAARSICPRRRAAWPAAGTPAGIVRARPSDSGDLAERAATLEAPGLDACRSRGMKHKAAPRRGKVRLAPGRRLQAAKRKDRHVLVSRDGTVQ